MNDRTCRVIQFEERSVGLLSQQALARDDRGIKEGCCRISDVLALLSLGRRIRC